MLEANRIWLKQSPVRDYPHSNLFHRFLFVLRSPNAYLAEQPHLGNPRRKSRICKMPEYMHAASCQSTCLCHAMYVCTKHVQYCSAATWVPGPHSASPHNVGPTGDLCSGLPNLRNGDKPCSD